MKKNIHFFDQGEANVKPQILERIGIRGRLAMELADLDLPILPGFIIDADVSSHLGDFDIWGALRPGWIAWPSSRERASATSTTPCW